MATQSSAALDDVIVPDGDDTFAAGQSSARQESAIPPGGYASGVNMDFDPFGLLVTRRGAKSVSGNVETGTWGGTTTTWTANTRFWGSTLTAGVAVDGACYFGSGTTQYIVLGQGGAIKYGNETTPIATVSGATYSGAFVYFAQLGARLYYCDGVGSLAYIDAAIANQAISAGRVTGLKILFEGIGYTSVPAITISSGAATFTGILGYGGRLVGASVTAAGSGYSATTPPSATVAAAPGGADDTATVRVLISQTPSKPKFITSHTGRLFCATADTAIPADTLYASDILDGESWDLVGASLRIGGDGDPITGIYPWMNNNLVVFKQRSIWMVDANPLVDPSEWTLKLLSNRVGCVSHRTIQSVGADIYFLSQDGVRALSQVESGVVADIGQPLSFPIQDKIDGITRSQQQYCCAIYYRNRYILSIPTGESAPPTIGGVVVWNELQKAWMGFWTGWQPREFFISGASSKTRLNWADAQGRLWTWDDFTNVTAETSDNYTDDATAYESYVITRAYHCGEPTADKLGHAAYFFTENRLTDVPVALNFSYDRDMSGSFTVLETGLSVAAGERRKRRTFNMISRGKWNCIQFKMGASAGRVAVVGIRLSAFVDNIKPELSS